jgi:hypothetical protein
LLKATYTNCKARCEKHRKLCRNGRGCRHAKFAEEEEEVEEE